MPKRSRLPTMHIGYNKKFKTAAIGFKRAPLRKAMPQRSTAELKELTVSGSAAFGTSGGTQGSYVASLVNMATGTDINNRIGRHISPKSFYLDVYVVPPTSVSGTAQFGGVVDTGFIALVYDSSPDGSAALFSNIFDTANSPTPGQAFRNTLQFRDRFTICWLEQVAIAGNYTAAATVGTPGYWLDGCRKFRKYFKVPSWMKTEYNASTSGVPNTGAFYIVGGSVNNSTSSSTDDFGFAYNSKMIFTDT